MLTESSTIIEGLVMLARKTINAMAWFSNVDLQGRLVAAM